MTLRLALSALGRGVMLTLLCLVLWLPGFFTLPPFDRDEARFAQASRQMVESGDYIDIRFQDQPRHKKPIGIYWLQAASAQLTGAVNAIWAYRIPSLLGALAAVLLTAAMAARFIGPRAGLVAGSLLASSLLLGVEARMGKTDAALLATIVLAQLMLLELYVSRALSRPRALLFWAALGAGILVKGPIILLAVGGPVLFLSILQQSGRWLQPLQPKYGVPLLLVMVAPWLVAITLRSHGAFWTESIGHDLMAKAVSVQEHKGAPPGFYLGTFFLTFWPWAPLALLAAPMVWRRRGEPLVQFLLAWILPLWWLFEMLPTKLVHYTLPAFPAVALLMALLLRQGVEATSPVLQRGAAGLGLLLVAVVALGVPLAPLAVFASVSQESLPFAHWLSAAPFSALALSSGLLLVAAVPVAHALRVTRPLLALGVAAVALVNFYAVTWSHTLPQLDALWVSRSAAQLVGPYRAGCPGPVASIGYSEPSLVFLLGTDTQLLAGTADLRPVDGCQLVLVESRQLKGGYTDLAALASVSGLNYSKGDPVTLYLFRRTGATSSP